MAVISFFIDEIIDEVFMALTKGEKIRLICAVSKTFVGLLYFFSPFL
jgi:hypothetical protein